MPLTKLNQIISKLYFLWLEANVQFFKSSTGNLKNWWIYQSIQENSMIGRGDSNKETIAFPSVGSWK